MEYYNKKNPYLLSQANRDKNLTHKSPRLRFSFDYAEKINSQFKKTFTKTYSFIVPSVDFPITHSIS